MQKGKSVFWVIIFFLLIVFAGVMYYFRAFYYTPEDYSAPAPLLSVDEIETIESLINISLPDSTQKIYCYYDNSDLTHLYVRIDLDNIDIQKYLGKINWISVDKLSDSNIEALVEPRYRRFMNSWVRHEILSWWLPDRERIRFIHESRTLRGEKEVSSVEILLEQHKEVGYRIYVSKTFYPYVKTKFKKLFPEKPNWDLRESKEYPMTN